MEELLKENPKLETTFNHIVRIKEYNIEEWVEYGKRYALNKGYEMDELANLAFYKAIDDYFGANKGISQDYVEEIPRSWEESSKVYLVQSQKKTDLIYYRNQILKFSIIQTYKIFIFKKGSNNGKFTACKNCK